MREKSRLKFCLCYYLSYYQDIQKSFCNKMILYLLNCSELKKLYKFFANFSFMDYSFGDYSFGVPSKKLQNVPAYYCNLDLRLILNLSS